MPVSVAILCDRGQDLRKFLAASRSGAAFDIVDPGILQTSCARWLTWNPETGLTACCRTGPDQFVSPFSTPTPGLTGKPDPRPTEKQKEPLALEKKRNLEPLSAIP